MPSFRLPYHNSIPYYLSAIWLASFCYYVLAIMWLFAAMSSSQLRRDNSFLVVATSAATDLSPRSLCSTAAAHPSFNQPTPTLQELDIGLEAVVADPSYDMLLGLLIDMLERSLALLGDIRRPVVHLRVRYDPRHVVQHYVRVQTQGRPDAPHPKCCFCTPPLVSGRPVHPGPDMVTWAPILVHYAPCLSIVQLLIHVATVLAHYCRVTARPFALSFHSPVLGFLRISLPFAPFSFDLAVSY